jgi:hypothetical protein
MKKHIVSFLAAFVFVTVMPACVCTAFAKQPAQLVMAADNVLLAADVTNKNVKTKPKAKVSTKDGEYEITVDRNAVKKSSGQSGETDTVSNVINYINRHFKPIGRYILLVIVARFLGVYMKKYRK